MDGQGLAFIAPSKQGSAKTTRKSRKTGRPVGRPPKSKTRKSHEESPKKLEENETEKEYPCNDTLAENQG